MLLDQLLVYGVPVIRRVQKISVIKIELSRQKFILLVKVAIAQSASPLITQCMLEVVKNLSRGLLSWLKITIAAIRVATIFLFVS